MAIVTSFVFFLVQNNRDRLGGLAQNFYDLMVGRSTSSNFYELIKRNVSEELIFEFRNFMVGRNYEGISGIISILKDRIASNDSIPEAHKPKFYEYEINFQQLIKLQKKIKSHTWTTLIYTSLNILFAVIVLAFTTCLTFNSSITFLSIGIILTSVNIFLYFRLIRLLL